MKVKILFQLIYSISFLNVRLTEGVPKQVRMAHLACIGEIISIYSFHILINIELFKGSRKVNGVAEVCNIPVLVNVQVFTGKQLHSELVRTTILKDFAEFEGISKCVHVWFGSLTSFLMRYRFGNVTNGSALIPNDFCGYFIKEQ